MSQTNADVNIMKTEMKSYTFLIVAVKFYGSLIN